MDQQRTQWFSLYHSLQHYKYHTYLMCKDEVGPSHTCVLHYTLIRFSPCFQSIVSLFGPPTDCVSPGACGRAGADGDGPEVSAERGLGGGALRSLWGADQSSAAGLPMIWHRPERPAHRDQQRSAVGLRKDSSGT